MRIPPSWAERAGSAVRGLPGVLGAGMVCIGLALMYVPAAFVAAGAFLLLLDRRVP